MKGKFYSLPSVITRYVNTGGGGEEIPDGIFGSGVGGDLTLSGNNTFSGPDLEYENITLNSGTYLLGLHSTENRAPALYVNGTLTLNSNVRLDNSGVHNPWRSIANYLDPRPGGPGGTDGGAGLPSGTANYVGNPGVDQLLPSIGSAGRPGMGVYPNNPTYPVGAAGGACNVVELTTLEQLTSRMYQGQLIGGGSGGGSSITTGGIPAGAGGGGGGVVFIYARNIVLGSGTVAYISALSGVYGTYTNGQQNGGYGGNGGIIIVCENFDPRIRLQAMQTSAPTPGSPHAFGGHVYLASKHLSGQYIYQVDGYYHPILLV